MQSAGHFLAEHHAMKQICRLVANHLAEVFGNLFEFSLDTQYDAAIIPARHFCSNLEPVRDRQRLLAQRQLPAVCGNSGQRRS